MSIIDTYLRNTPAEQRQELERIRKLILQIAPEAEEAISYGMPAFKYRGKYLVGFNAFKDHLSIFPTSGPVEAFASQLAAYTTSKGTVQFTLDAPLSDEIIIALVKHRLDAIK